MIIDLGRKLLKETPSKHISGGNLCEFLSDLFTILKDVKCYGNWLLFFLKQDTVRIRESCLTVILSNPT